MTVQAYLFEDVELPQFNALTNIGTGAALSNFQQLPGGGFFDNYGRADSPQGIRDLSYSCWIVSTDAATRKTTLDNLRKYIGHRGKLSVRYDDGSIRWQWARLTQVEAPDDVKAVQWLPVDMRFVTADQHWNGIIQGTGDWTWGDGTWLWGDGTVVMGQTSTTETITSTGAVPANLPTVTQAGNKDVTSLQLTVTAVTNTITVLKIENATVGNGTKFTYTPTSPSSIAVDEHFYLDCGSYAAYHLAADKVVTDIAQSGLVSTVTCTSHGYSTNNLVRIYGTLYNDGVYTITGTTTHTFTYTNVYGRTEVPTYCIANKATNVYSQVVFGRKDRWFTLSPGDNTITCTVTGNAAQAATILFEYYEHYA